MSAQGSTVEFGSNGRRASGYLIVPERQNNAALVVIHEWWGLNDHIKDVARRFADEGYTVLAPDLYDGTVTKDAGEAGKLMQGLDQSKAIQALDAAVDYLKSVKGVDANKIAITGFCMGGSFALLMATHNDSIKAAAPFYGDVPPDDSLKNLSAPILFIGAENDQWITVDKMERLRNAMQINGKEGEVKIYSGVGHAFFNDTRARGL